MALEITENTPQQEAPLLPMDQSGVEKFALFFLQTVFHQTAQLEIGSDTVEATQLNQKTLQRITDLVRENPNILTQDIAIKIMGDIFFIITRACPDITVRVLGDIEYYSNKVRNELNNEKPKAPTPIVDDWGNQTDPKAW